MSCPLPKLSRRRTLPFLAASALVLPVALYLAAPCFAEPAQPGRASQLDRAVAGNSAIVPAPKLEEDGYDWQARHAEILRIQKEVNPELVFVGDSITHAWGGLPGTGARHTGEKVLRTAFAGHRILNLGFGWDRTQNVLWRLNHGELDGVHPRAIVLLIGTNNTSDTSHARKNTAAEIVEGIREILRRLRAKAPAARIILMGVLPREAKPDHPRRLEINEVNRRLAAEFGHPARGAGVVYLNIGPKLVEPDGTVSRAVLSDFCHPTEHGYQIWADALQPLLKPVLD